ncbi:MAG: class I SAM-dependent methyltransferase [Candidatus Marinimicrobia bacterium]|nr:class I SAM-dependent methyltransferase [Candidatus Neomarinimicrobiota bacterium]
MKNLIKKFYHEHFITDLTRRLTTLKLFDEVRRDGGKILIIGAGGMNEWKFFENQCFDVHVLDLRKIEGPKHFYQQSITEKTPFNDQEFDYIIMSIVLEYVIDDIRALQEIFRILKDGGSLIIQIYYYKDKTNFPLRIYSRDTITDILKYVQFKIIRIYPWGFMNYLFSYRLIKILILLMIKFFIKDLSVWVKIDKLLSKKFDFMRKYISFPGGGFIVCRKNHSLKFQHYVDI